MPAIVKDITLTEYVWCIYIYAALLKGFASPTGSPHEHVNEEHDTAAAAEEALSWLTNASRKAQDKKSVGTLTAE